MLLLGAAIYWCEGTKSKPWRRGERLAFINSDPGLLGMFPRFLEAQGIDRAVPTYRVTIHETADADAATRWWAERLDLPPGRFRRPTVKRHVPRRGGPTLATTTTVVSSSWCRARESCTGRWRV